MRSVEAISSISSRIGEIQAQIAMRTGADFNGATSLEVAGPLDPTAGFEPFGEAYRRALAAVGGGAGSPVGQTRGTVPAGQIGDYGPMPVPPELAIYGNGNVPPAVLTPIGQGGHRLWSPAADAWMKAVAAAKVDGVHLAVTDSYRSYQQQVDLAERKGLSANGGLAAVPGTSNHGWGLAVDADTSQPGAISWLQANGRRFGFVQISTREPWHWEYRPSQA